MGKHHKIKQILTQLCRSFQLEGSYLSLTGGGEGKIPEELNRTKCGNVGVTKLLILGTAFSNPNTTYIGQLCVDQFMESVEG